MNIARNNRENMLKGFVNITKPLNMTSSDVVVIVRGILRRATGEKQKVGHLGTLDPLANGVLPIAIGNATRLFDYSQQKTKVYQAIFKFGVTTDTLDCAGKITENSGIIPKYDEICEQATALCGEIEQIPPQYSAKSVDGHRAYDLARLGVQVDLKPKKVRIDSIIPIQPTNGYVRLSSGEYPLSNDEVAFEISCGSGTYIRAIARDIAEALGTVGYMTHLERIKSGQFDISNSVTLEQFQQTPLEYLKPINILLNEFEEFEIPSQYIDKVLNGVRVKFDNMPNGDFIATNNGEIVGIAHSIDGALCIKTRL